MTTSIAGMIRVFVGFLLVVTLSVSCRRPLVKEPSEEGQALVGSWQKISPAKCSEIYPDVIEFSNNGVYQTLSEVTTVTIAWVTGSYEVDGQLIKIANLQDVAKTYRFVIKNETVTFEDEQGCRFPYRRM